MWGFHDGFGWLMLVGMCMMAFGAIIIGLVVWGVGRATGSRGQHRGTEETPMEVARKRLARGEITREEFEALSEALR